MMKMTVLVLITIFNSCSVFKTTKLSNNLSKEIQKVCLSAEGKGRLIISGKKYVFSYDSGLDQKENKWMMSFSFPLYGEELVVIDWDQQGNTTYHFSFEDKILKEQNGLSPENLELFFKKWSSLLFEIIMLKNDQNYQPKLDWKIHANFLEANIELNDSDISMDIVFKNLVDSNEEKQYFGRYDVSMQQKKSNNSFRIESIVRNCLE